MGVDVQNLYRLSDIYLNKLCVEIDSRCVGSRGNREATKLFEKELILSGWDTWKQEFDAIDWEDGGAELICGDLRPEVFVSPYSNGCDTKGKLICISDPDHIDEVDIKGKIVLLYGRIAKEQLMPKNFVFYNPVKHKRIIDFLESGKPEAIICATGRNAALAGGVYPFPLIEDGDFDIPSVFMTEEEGKKIIPFEGTVVNLRSVSRRISGKGVNVIGSRGKGDKRIVITAHIDAKKGTPGAIDNATGVIVLLLLARLLKNYQGNKKIELIAFNGEDYYAVPGQMLFIKENDGQFENIVLNINIDGAGFKEGKSAISFYGIPEELKVIVGEIIKDSDELIEGVQWPQGDHSIFVQFGVPAIAVTSNWFSNNIGSQDITHTARDNPMIVDTGKLVKIGLALNDLINRI